MVKTNDVELTIDSAREWVHALRSGEYRQAHGRLRDKDYFCCLGVYCDLMVKRGEGSWNEENQFVFNGYTATNQIQFIYEGERLTDEPDVAWNDETSDFARHLADLNDDGAALAGLEEAEPYTFNQIADVIEKRLGL